MTFGHAPSRIFPATVLCLALAGCSGSPSGSTVLTADMPLHLEDHLDAATIVGSEVPAEVPSAVEWRFDEPQPDWKPAVPLHPAVKPAQLTRTDDALRVTLTDTPHYGIFPPGGGLYIDLPDWQRGDWAHVIVRARTSEGVSGLILQFNLREGPDDDEPNPFNSSGEFVNVIHDGSVQTYRLRADWSMMGEFEGPWQQLGLWFGTDEPASIDLLSVSIIPKCR